MRTSLIALALIAALPGCTRIIERPAAAPSVVTTPAISERTVERSSATGATASSCTWASQAYSSGATTCQERTEYRCQNGTWERSNASC